MASIDKRVLRNGVERWRVQYRVGGKLTGATFDNPRGAQEFGELVDKMGGEYAQSALAARRGNSTDAPTLREFTQKYLSTDSGLLTGIEQGTRDGYSAAAERSFLVTLGEFPVDAITKADVGRWVAWQEKQPSARRKGETVSAKTVKNYHAVLSSVLAAAVEAGLRADNPAYKTRLSRGVKREAVFLSPAEFRTVLHFTPDYYKLLVHLLASTGVRWGEATALHWGDVVLNGTPPIIRITKAWKKATGGPILKHPKSSKSRRSVSVYAALAAELSEGGASDELVFKGKLSGGHLWYGRFRSSTWEPTIDKATDKKLCAAAGLTPLTKRPTIHDLRHTHASWLIAAGVPLPYVQARLGHEKITTTVDTYGHLVADAHEQMASVVAVTLEALDRPLAVEQREEIIVDLSDE